MECVRTSIASRPRLHPEAGGRVGGKSRPSATAETAAASGSARRVEASCGIHQRHVPFHRAFCVEKLRSRDRPENRASLGDSALKPLEVTRKQGFVQLLCEVWPCTGLNGKTEGRRVTVSAGTVPLAAGRHEKLPWAPSKQGAVNRHALPTRFRNLRLTIDSPIRIQSGERW